MHQVSVRFLFCSLKFDWEGESCKGLEMRALESRTERNRQSHGWEEREVHVSQRIQTVPKPGVVPSFRGYLQTQGELTARRRMLPLGLLGVTRSKAAGSRAVSGMSLPNAAGWGTQ